MPLIKNLELFNNTRLLVWEVTEPLEELLDQITLSENSRKRFGSMKSEMHQRAFISVRRSLGVAGYSDADLYYDAFGKPNLRDGKHISISHSHQYSAVIISDEVVGVDLEWAREKIIRIATKFAVSELPNLQNCNDPDLIRKLTVIWGIKESIFKIRNEPGISFKDHIAVAPFELASQTAKAELHFCGISAEFDVFFDVIDEFVLVYAFETAK